MDAYWFRVDMLARKGGVPLLLNCMKVGRGVIFGI
jgi:hypothetical protein